MLTIYVVKIPHSPDKHGVLRKALPTIGLCQGMDSSVFNIVKEGMGKIKIGDISVNITYADHYAFVFLSKQRFGIDAETIKHQPKACRIILSRWLSTPINNDMDFYRAWTAMEAEVKYYGDRGLFDVIEGRLHKNKELQTIYSSFQNNMIAIASDSDNIMDQETFFVEI